MFVSIVLCTLQTDEVGDARVSDAMQHTLDDSNDSRLHQHLFTATMSKDSVDTKQYSTEAWDGNTLTALYEHRRDIQSEQNSSSLG